jgi:hypothetical protein
VGDPCGGHELTNRDVRVPILSEWSVTVEILVNDFEKIALEDKSELRR